MYIFALIAALVVMVSIVREDLVSGYALTPSELV